MSESKKEPNPKLKNSETRFVTNTNYSRIPAYNELNKVKTKPPKKVLVSKNVSRATIANSVSQSRARSYSETTCKTKRSYQPKRKNTKVKETERNKSVYVSQVSSCPNCEKKPFASSLDKHNEVQAQNDPQEAVVKNAGSEHIDKRIHTPTSKTTKTCQTKLIISKPINTNRIKNFNRINLKSSTLNVKSNINQSLKHNKSIQTCARFNSLKEVNLNFKNPSTVSCTFDCHCDDCICNFPIPSDENNMQWNNMNTLNVSDIRNFREKYFFECHSIDSRLKDNESTHSVKHKCSYDYYLNKRLFPVPVCSDHKNVARCVECLLPPSHNRCQGSQRSCDEQSDNASLSDTRSREREEKGGREILNAVNGRIKTKVSLSNFNRKLADAVIKIPVNNKMVINERTETKNLKQKKSDRGILKLTSNPVRPTILTPEDSLALRYQKGYREFKGDRGVKQFAHYFDVK